MDDQRLLTALSTPLVLPKGVYPTQTVGSQSTRRVMTDVDRCKACEADIWEICRKSKIPAQPDWGGHYPTIVPGKRLTWTLLDLPAHRIIVIAILACSSALESSRNITDSATLNELLLLGCSNPSTWETTTPPGTGGSNDTMAMHLNGRGPPQFCRERIQVRETGLQSSIKFKV